MLIVRGILTAFIPDGQTGPLSHICDYSLLALGAYAWRFSRLFVVSRFWQVVQHDGMYVCAWPFNSSTISDLFAPL